MITFSDPWSKVGLGNNFFMYVYMRLIAEELGYKLEVPSVTFWERNGHIPQQYFFKNIDGINNTGKPVVHVDDGFTTRMETIDKTIEFFKDKDVHIDSCGWFQKYPYWIKYKDRVRGYFSEWVSKEDRPKDEVAIHLRYSYQNPITKLDPQYYIDSIEKMGVNKVYLFADDFNRHEDVLKALEKYNPIIMSMNVPDTINEISKFNKIICSQGSFSFWVSFLSRAERIIWPITRVGPNRTDDINIDYVVSDEPRYEFVNL
jgi:hypothetical protein